MAGIGFDYLNAKWPPGGPGWPPMLNFATFQQNELNFSINAHNTILSILAGIGFGYVNVSFYNSPLYSDSRQQCPIHEVKIPTVASLHCTVLVLTLVLHLPAGPPAPSPPFHCGALGLRWGRVVGTRWRVITHHVHLRCRCRCMYMSCMYMSCMYMWCMYMWCMYMCKCR